MFDIRDRKQFWSGLVFLVVGAAALLALPEYIGTVRQMGPGYFPMLLGIGMMLVGLGSVVLSFRAPEIVRIDELSLTPVVFIISGVVAAALLIDNYGLAISMLAIVLTTCYSRVLKHPIEIAIIYIAVLFLTWGVFIYLIQLPIKLY